LESGEEPGAAKARQKRDAVMKDCWIYNVDWQRNKYSCLQQFLEAYP
jgi:hypothetical protein